MWNTVENVYLSTINPTGQKIVALVEASGAVCVERFKDYPQLGRFTLRDEGKTVAIGKVSQSEISETVR